MIDTKIRKILLLNIFIINVVFFSNPVLSQVNCQTLPHWITLDNGLKLNQTHVFCGEWHKGRAKGFHARPHGRNPQTIKQFTIQEPPNAAGIYTGRWSYQNHPGKNKFSSMFPDQCTPRQILNSISFATSDSNTKCPQGAPSWTRCGKNKPRVNNENTAKYCQVNGQFFTIGYAPPRKGKINTAFPLFQ